jgi:hypothetical protein
MAYILYCYVYGIVMQLSSNFSRNGLIAAEAVLLASAVVVP